MTRNVTLIMVLALLIVFCCLIIFGTANFVTEHFETANELKIASEEYKKNVEELDNAVSSKLPSKKRILDSTIEQYEETKAEYESVVAKYSTMSALQVLSDELSKDIYDVDFLWTIVGNYATEEGVNLKFDVTKNTTSPESYSNNSNDYVVCDLKFSITGSYIHLTDFIYDIEDDDRLNFEINDFNMIVNAEATESEPLNATFVVYSIKLNTANLIETYSVVSDPSLEDKQNTNNTGTTNTNKTTTSVNTTNTATTKNTSSTNTVN